MASVRVNPLTRRRYQEFDDPMLNNILRPEDWPTAFLLGLQRLLRLAGIWAPLNGGSKLDISCVPRPPASLLAQSVTNRIPVALRARSQYLT
jgi:hypothetical protein